MNKSYSELQQERAGTLNRNRQIKKDYKPGLGGKIGRAQNPPISRQAIHQIVHRTYTRKKDGLFIRLCETFTRWMGGDYGTS